MIYTKNFKHYRNIVYATFIIVVILISVASVAAKRAEMNNIHDTPPFDEEYPGFDLPRKIAVIYDNNHSILVNTALNVFTSAGIIYHNIHLIPVGNWNDLRLAMLENSFWIKLYFINGKLDGVFLGDNTIKWETIAKTIEKPLTFHVFGSGSTDQLRPLVPVNETKVRIEGSPVLGAEQSYFYNLWEIGDIMADDPGLGYQRAAEDFRILGVKYFAENINRILNGIMVPEKMVNPLGEEDHVAKARAWDEKMESWADAYQVMPDQSIRRFDNDSTPVPETQVRIFNENDNEAEFKISDLPFFSGIEGPTAEVIDAILSVLIKFGGSALGLDPETAIDICNTIKDIALMFSSSDEGEGDVKGTIKKLITLITDNAPIPEKIKPFLPLVVDALYLIRGDPTDITDFAGSIVETIFTVIGDVNNTAVNTMLKILKGTLLNGVELAEKIISEKEKAEEDGKKFNLLNTIVGFAIDKVLNASTYSWWASVLNDTKSPLLKEIGKMMGFLSPLVKAFTTGDFDDLMETIPDFVEYLFQKMTKQNLTSREESAISTISEFYRTAMAFFDAFTLPGKAMEYWTIGSENDTANANQKMLFKVVDAALPMLGVTLSANDQRVSLFSKDLISIITTASVDQLTDRNQLKQLISSSMSKNSLPTDSTEAETLIDALAWLGAICIPSMPEPFASDIKSVSKQFLNITAVNETVSDTKERVFFIVLETIFGIIALGKQNTAAQLLLVDDASKLSEGAMESMGENKTLELKEIQTKIVLIGRDAVLGLFEIWIDGLNTTEGIKSGLKTGVKVFANGILFVAQVLLSAKGNSITSFLRAAAMQAGALLFDYIGLDGTAMMEVIQSLFTGLVGNNILGGDAAFNATQTCAQLQEIVRDALEEKEVAPYLVNLAEKGIYYLFMIKDLMSGGIDFIFKEFKTLLASFLADLISDFTGKIADKISAKPLLNLGGDIPLPGGDVIGIKLSFNLSIGLNIYWDNEAFREWIEDIIFTGINDFKLDIPAFFTKIITFISFAPVFSASLTASTVSSGGGGVFGAVLAPLGIDLEVWGSIGFSIQLFSFASGGFDPEGFMKILEWHFSIGFKVSKDITLIEIILYCTGGGAAAAGTVNKAMKYIGLDVLTLTIWLSAAFEIYQKAAHNGEPAQGSLTLTLGIGAYITIGLDLRIVGIVFKIGLDIYLIFHQDLTPGNLGPFTITLDIVFWAKLTLTFLFWDFEIGFEFRPPGFPLKLLPPPDSPELKEDALGYDSDNDGLSDAQENESASLDPYKADTDGDGLSDKYELKVSGTDPGKYDTDGDGLSDFIEWYGVHSPPKADPNIFDTDMDGLSDGEEVLLYGTNPNSRDTDMDGLTDFFEVTTDWIIPSQINTSQQNNTWPITPSVTAVKIGDQIYDNRTDPLNPDTDNDGLLDGQEGEFGAWWGNPNNYPAGADKPMLLFNEGYTHPLDNDTDDDSFYQYYDGSIAGTSESKVYTRDMRDGVEVKGIAATLIEDGEPVSKVFQTNPCNPDSDGDTGQGREPVIGGFLNSDGYELSLDPASDPLDADTDDDGLIDGLEGTLLFERNMTTNFYNPDTDGDTLPDGIEIALGLDPANPDSDNDLILDGDEFFIFNTNPHMPDTDYDGVDDYWELFFSHSNPHSADSDGDGLKDATEIYTYGTDPMDEDSDNDDITDRDEIIEFGTDPMNPDSDGDGIRDGPEIFKYETDPNNIDSDYDSILSPDENGDPTYLWTDYDEIQFGTNPRSIDSDNDSIFDTWELYLAYGEIPNFENIPLDALDNDTDDDGLIDGKELVIGEIEILVYPFVAYQTIFPLLTSPVDPDSDDDKLGDKFEVDNNLRPDLVDSDNDTLSDWDEIYRHYTDPRKNDTDGDGITDQREITRFTPAGIGSDINDYDPVYFTNALDPDTDGDGWPDGLEIYATDGDPRYNPYNPDVNNNGILDGYERDFDHDLISDGDEYYTYSYYGTDVNNNGVLDGYEHGGFLDYRNPDSDFDGIMDGDEILVYGTLPYTADTDLDGYSDPLELWIGTDPLRYTPEEDFLAAVLRLTSPLQMKSPMHNGTYSAGAISFELLNLTSLTHVSFRYREVTESEITNQSTTPTSIPTSTPATTPATTTSTIPITTTTNESSTDEWQGNFTMKYQGYSRWTHSAKNFDEGEYEIQIFGLAPDYSYPTSPDRVIGTVLLENTIRFRVVKTEIDWLPIIGLGFAAAVVLASAAFIAFWIIKRRQALI
ncbi:MAG: hypothetical protein JSW11_07760 [Candidatus Heimdallarchaeota archaeon]|nr:MAG: hypothetical protein JSW11_07760 [Candidatus Heimdallarchaeota archaeon]